MQAQREPVAREREDAREHRDRPRRRARSAKRSSASRSKTICVIANCAPASSFAPEALGLELEVVGGRVDGDADEERRRRVDRPAVEVLAAVQARDQLREPDRVDLVDAARARVVADLGRVAGDREDVAHALGVRAEQHRLEAERSSQSRVVRCGTVSSPALALDRAGDHQRAHAGARGRVVVDVDEADAARVARARARRSSRPRLEPPSGGSSCTETTNSPSRSARAKLGLALLLAERRDELALVRPRAARAPARFSSIAARIAAISVGVVPQQPPITPRAEVARVRGELGEVLGRRVRVDDAAAGEAREADVRQRRERAPVALHLLERRRARPAGRRRGSRRTRRRRAARAARPPRARVTPASVSAPSSKVISATIGSARDAAHAPRSRRRARRGRRTSRA